MPSKKSSSSKSSALTKEFFVEQLQSLEKRFDRKLEQQKHFLTVQIEASRNDAKEQINSVSAGLTKEMNNLKQKIDHVELKVESLHDKVRFIGDDVKEIKQKLDGVIEKVERHDEEIVFLKSAVSRT